jgi:hypothetical protein
MEFGKKVLKINGGVILAVLLVVMCVNLHAFPSTKKLCSKYLVLSQAQIAKSRLLFDKVVVQKPVEPEGYADLNLKVFSEDDVTYVFDDALSCSGNGYFIYNPTAKNEILIQAVHQYSDGPVGDILRHFQEEDSFKALAFNSHRRSSQADIAHNNDSYLKQFSLSFIERYPNAAVIQLHGFLKEKRKTKLGREADIIISNGNQNPSENLQKMAACLSKHWLTKIYPWQVKELGGTTNAVGRVLPAGSFIHIEMNTKVRDELRLDKSSRDAFLACLS